MLTNDQQKNSMASFEFDFPAISAGTTFVFGSWVYTADGSGGFSSHLIDTTIMKTLQQEQLSETTSIEILLPQLAEEIESLSLSDTTLTRFPLRLENSAASYSAIFRRKNLTQNSTMTRTAPQFDSYPDSDEDFNSDLLNFSSLTIMETPQSQVVY